MSGGALFHGRRSAIRADSRRMAGAGISRDPASSVGGRGRHRLHRRACGDRFMTVASGRGEADGAGALAQKPVGNHKRTPIRASHRRLRTLAMTVHMTVTMTRHPMPRLVPDDARRIIMSATGAASASGREIAGPYQECWYQRDDRHGAGGPSCGISPAASPPRYIGASAVSRTRVAPPGAGPGGPL